MDDFALTAAERALLSALNQRGARFIVVGLGAAVLQGAPLSTQDIDLWLEAPGSDAVRMAAADAGGFWIAPFGAQPPAFGGDGLERIDVVLTAHGLEPFDTEYARAEPTEVDGIPVRVLGLERIVASKRAKNRPKDLAALPALEATLRARNER
ncbi:MAG: hypothetical protein AB1635_01245 [Acidobacteriota bacterium]